MNEKENADLGPPQESDFRRKAEQRLHNKKAPPVDGMAEADVRALLHELQVHQIELEMQNEELLRTQTAVQEVSDKYHDLFDFAPIGYFRLDEQGRILEVNLAGASLLGLDRSTAVKQRFAQFVAMEHRVAFDDFSKRVLATAAKQTCEIELRRNEEPVHAVVEGVPAEAGEGKRFLRITVTDITARRQAEEAIKDRDEELVTIYENAPVIMLLVDVERRVRKANKYARQFAGASDAELIGRRGGEALRCVHAPDDPRGCGFGQRCRHCPVRRTVLETLADGRSRHQVEVSMPFAIDEKAQDITFLLSTARLNVRGQPQVLVVIQNITERKQLEKAMATLASFPTLNPSPVVDVDLAGQVHFLNPAARRLSPDLEQQGGAHPWLADWDSVARAFREDSAQEVVREVTVGEDCYQQMMHYLKDIERVRIYAMDITPRKRAEEALQRTTAELARSNKDLEQFASVASHDLQEPLRAVIGFVQLLQQKYKNQLGAEADQFIEFAVDGGRQMETLIRDLLAYARVGSQAKELAPTDAGAALRQALGNLSTRIHETAAEITCGELPTIRADSVQLVQLFQNLVGNALKFRAEEPPRIRVDASRNENHWLFTVRDNGIGIAQDSLERVFSIFERLHTRTQYPGTGIGLAICKKIVDRHGGTIWVESQPGQGAVFYFTMPI
jgi:PAS domain S-box-containing protein